MTACAQCREPVAAAATFCRSCGAPVRVMPEPTTAASRDEAGCRSCGALVSPEARFCRTCGATVEEETWPGSDEVTAAGGQGETRPHAAPPGGAGHCDVCGGAVGEGETTCWSCSSLLGGDVSRPTPATAADAELASATSPTSDRRGRRRLLVAATAALFAAGGGAAAYFLVVAPDKGGEEADDSARNADAADVPRGDEAESSSDDPEEAAEGDAGGASLGDEAGGGGARSESVDPGETPDPAGLSGSGADFRAAERALRDHYAAIDKGDYRRALKRFHPDYRSGRAGRRFVRLKRAGRPAIDLESLAVDRVAGGSEERLVLRVDFVAADTAGADRRCRRFMGAVQMEMSNGEWTYRPGGRGEARPALETVPISPGDARCPRRAGKRNRPRG